MLKKQRVSLALALSLSLPAFITTAMFIAEADLSATANCYWWGNCQEEWCPYSPGACLAADGGDNCASTKKWKCKTDGNWACVADCNSEEEELPN